MAFDVDDKGYGDDWAWFVYGGARVDLTHIQSGREGAISARVKVSWLLGPDAGTVLRPKRVNLVGNWLTEADIGRCIHQLPDEMGINLADQKRNWHQFFTRVAMLAVEHFEQGDPLIPIIEAEEHPHRWVLAPICDDTVTVAAAPPGSAKSFLGAAVALSIATGHRILQNKPRVVGPVAYLDWEENSSVQINRLRALAASHDLEIPAHLHYRREVKPLAATARDYAREFANKGIVFCVIDSQGKAMGGSMLEDEAVRGLYHGIRQLAVPVFVITQVTAEAIRNGAKRPYGNVFTDYEARRIWLQQSAPRRDGSEMLTQWTLTKANNDQLGQRLAYRWVFDQDPNTLHYRQIDVECIDPWEDKQVETDARPLHDRIKALLTVRPMGTAEMANMLDKSPSQVATACAKLGTDLRPHRKGEPWELAWMPPEEAPY